MHTERSAAPVDKSTLIREMEQLTQDQEEAIRHHPPQTVAVYENGRDAFVRGQEGASETDWSRGAGLSLRELSILHRYMLCSSFISAWYDLNGGRAQRDQAANTCVLLVASVGLNPEMVMGQYLRYEQLWRQGMRSERIAPSSRRGIMFLGGVIIALVLAYFLLG